MEAFKAAFINEIDKMYRKKKAIVVVAISIISIIMGQLLVLGVRKGFGIRTVSGTDFPILVLSVFVDTILPLFTTLIVIDIFSGEFNQNTMKIALLRPVTRLKIFAAKICTTGFFVLANLLAVMILSTLSGILFNSASITVTGIYRVFISYLVTFLPIMVFALIIVFLSNVLRGSTAVFFVTIIVYIAFKGSAFVFPKYSSMFVTSMFNWYELWIADTLPLLKIGREFLIMLGCAIMFFTAGYYLFDKKDL
ncbi:ABC transporter permease [Herbivorax sp. ANBcel31]|uniref:ABC transporter permease n=1 Tax=Herbivorax sp. ANBcel31 TaxID=3069754 RepID=UPI0027ADB6A0|nr:ABC transporter permease [Herbivorax sp. ANBcel31]MDQ2087789.1 ABC transporter permease [Herbivorax sp. ANBcel31]